MQFRSLVTLSAAALMVAANGHATLAGTFTTITVAGSALTGATGISGNTIVGTYENGAVGNAGHGFTDDSGIVTTFDEPNSLWNPFGNNTIPLGTYVLGADKNTLVGWYNMPAGASLGFAESQGVFIDINVPGTSLTSATSVDNNTVVGIADSHGFSETNGVYSLIDYPGASVTEAWGISGNTIVGNYFGSSSTGHQGFIDVGGAFSTLNYPGANSTYIYDISGNTVVGTYEIGNSAFDFAEADGVFITLNVPGTIAVGGEYPVRISGNTVVGTYFDNSGTGHGFITTVEVPEPATIGMGTVAGVMIFRRRRRSMTA